VTTTSSRTTQRPGLAAYDGEAHQEQQAEEQQKPVNQDVFFNGEILVEEVSDDTVDYIGFLAWEAEQEKAMNMEN
jgi:hypothetical protein